MVGQLLKVFQDPQRVLLYVGQGHVYVCIYTLRCCGRKAGKPDPNLLEDFRGRFPGKFRQFRANARDSRGIVKGRVGEDAIDQIAHPPPLELCSD